MCSGCVPSSTVHSSVCLLSLFLSSPGFVWVGMPVILCEDHSPWLKILNMNADFWNVQSILVHVWMLGGSGTILGPAESRCYGSPHSRCPGVLNWGFYSNILQRLFTNLCPAFFPVYFQTYFDDRKKMWQWNHKQRRLQIWHSNAFLAFWLPWGSTSLCYEAKSCFFLYLLVCF